MAFPAADFATACRDLDLATAEAIVAAHPEIIRDVVVRTCFKFAYANGHAELMAFLIGLNSDEPILAVNEPGSEIRIDADVGSYASHHQSMYALLQPLQSRVLLTTQKVATNAIHQAYYKNIEGVIVPINNYKDECSICKDRTITTRTTCNHMFCLPCVIGPTSAKKARLAQRAEARSCR